MTVSPRIAEQLSKLPMLQHLTAAETGELFGITESSTLATGELLFKEGDPANSLVFVVSGDVHITKKNQTLATVGPGSVLGEMTLLGASTTRSATGTAKSTVEILSIPMPRFQKLINEGNVAALKVVANLARVLGKRLLTMDEKLVEVMAQGTRKEELRDFQATLSRWAF